MSLMPRYASVPVGFELPELEVPPISRSTLAYYAGASGDRNPIHIDIDYAHAAGQPDVFVHGMLVMASAGRVLTDWAGPSALLEFGARFNAVTNLFERLHCRARVVGKSDSPNGGNLELVVEVRNEAGELKLSARALVVLE